jgi:hypothetical protein
VGRDSGRSLASLVRPRSPGLDLLTDVRRALAISVLKVLVLARLTVVRVAVSVLPAVASVRLVAVRVAASARLVAVKAAASARLVAVKEAFLVPRLVAASVRKARGQKTTVLAMVVSDLQAVAVAAAAIGAVAHVAVVLAGASAEALVVVVDAAAGRGAGNRAGVPDHHGATAAGSLKWVSLRWDSDADSSVGHDEITPAIIRLHYSNALERALPGPSCVQSRLRCGSVITR